MWTRVGAEFEKVADHQNAFRLLYDPWHDNGQYTHSIV